MGFLEAMGASEGGAARLAVVAALAASAATACMLAAYRITSTADTKASSCAQCAQCQSQTPSFVVSAPIRRPPSKGDTKPSLLSNLDGASTPPSSSPIKLSGGRVLEEPSPLRARPDRGGAKVDPYSPDKRRGYLEWDDYFMAVAFLSALRSKDPNRQVGACIVGVDRIILGIGYNGFPRGCADDALPWAKMSAENDPLETKYPYVCHAEMNAILNKNHASLDAASIYVTMYPCNECAKLIIQAGLKRVVYFQGKLGGAGKVDPSYLASNRMFELAKVEVIQHCPKDPIILPFSHE